MSMFVISQDEIDRIERIRKQLHDVIDALPDNSVEVSIIRCATPTLWGVTHKNRQTVDEYFNG